MGNSTFGILLGRKSSKFMSYLKHAITRSSYLKNRQQALYSYSNLDVVQLLNLGHQDQALVRVEHVIKSKDMLDVFDMIDSYCNLLAQNSSFIQKSKECQEYKEAIGGLIFASSRIGDFPELQHIRNYFTSKFGHDFVIQALESPTYFGVNDKIIQKLSRNRPSLETKFNFVKEIASKNEIRVDLHLDAHIQQH